MKKLLAMMLTFVMLAGCADKILESKVVNPVQLNTKVVNPEQIEVAICPAGGGSETYHFILAPNGEMIVEFGTSTGDDLTQRPFMEKNGKYDFQSKTKQLSADAVEKIYSLVDAIYAPGHPLTDGVVFDTWEIQILYQNEVVIEPNYYGASLEINALVDKLKSISPIEVNLHGWA